MLCSAGGALALPAPEVGEEAAPLDAEEPSSKRARVTPLEEEMEDGEDELHEELYAVEGGGRGGEETSAGWVLARATRSHLYQADGGQCALLSVCSSGPFTSLSSAALGFPGFPLAKLLRQHACLGRVFRSVTVDTVVYGLRDSACKERVWC